MDIENLKLEFYKQINSLLTELTKKTDIVPTDLELSEIHIEQFETNISPFIDDIIVNNQTIFETNEILLIENINLSSIWNLLNEEERGIILKYLQTIYLIVNVYNKNNHNTDIKKMMKKIKSSLTEHINTDNNSTKAESANTEPDEEPKQTDTNRDNDIDESIKQVEGLFNNMGSGDGNNIFKLAMDMTKDIMKDPNFNLNDLMSGNNNTLSDMMSNISSKIDNKCKSGEINQEDIMKDATKFMKNMKNNPMMNNLMNNMNNLNSKQKKKLKKKLKRTSTKTE